MPRSVHLILGANSGIARALIPILVDRDARVMVAARDPDRAAALGAEYAVPHVTVDARSFDGVLAAAEAAKEEFGRLDGIANLAGSLLLKPAHATTEEEYRDCVDANLTTAFAAVRAAGSVMRKGGGSVVLVSSAAARIGFANHEAIAAAKAGVQGLILSAAATYGPRGIRVNGIAPGLVRTPLTERLVGTEAGEKRSADMHALGRIGEPEDVARAVAWLLDPAQGWVTGQILGVDGGLGAVRAR